MNKQIDALLQKEMSRKEFMATLGAGIVAIMGFSHLIRLLTGKEMQSPLQRDSLGYGSQPYGGRKSYS